VGGLGVSAGHQETTRPQHSGTGGSTAARHSPFHRSLSVRHGTQASGQDHGFRYHIDSRDRMCVASWTGRLRGLPLKVE